MAGFQTLFLIDDIIADETLNKKRQPLLGLAILRRHEGHLLWSLMQPYTAFPMNIRRQAKMPYLWFQKKRGDWDNIHEENDVIERTEKLANVKKQLKLGKHTCLVMRKEHPNSIPVPFFSFFGISHVSSRPDFLHSRIIGYVWLLLLKLWNYCPDPMPFRPSHH